MNIEVSKLIRENRPALLFIIKFVGLYLALNTLYGLLIQSFYPAPDPFTIMVARHVVGFLSWFGHSLSINIGELSPYVTVMRVHEPVIDIFEGCNALNVIIVFAVFLVAFGGKRHFVAFLVAGVIILYFVNLLRVAMLYWVAIYWPDSMYFFHKFLFTAIIYGVVIVLWFFWIRHVKKSISRSQQN